jgi:hypothetical protein
MKAAVLYCLIAMWPAHVYAGNLFGTLFENGQPAKEAQITVTCGSNTYDASTDEDGAYTIRATEAGRCAFSVNYKDKTAETEIFAYDQPTRYDFDLVTAGAKYTLKKR